MTRLLRELFFESEKGITSNIISFSLMGPTGTGKSTVRCRCSYEDVQHLEYSISSSITLPSRMAKESAMD
jgi:guanylate kinase